MKRQARTSIVLSESELREMLSHVETLNKERNCKNSVIVLNGPIQKNGVDYILHFHKASIYSGSGVELKQGS